MLYLKEKAIGDGLGYYSYLPAKIIYNDPLLDFKWFNNAYNKAYVYSAFENPEDNLLVGYNDKKINKYYPGLSFIWLPFFLMAHVFVKLFSLVPDGFSWPYQYAMGLASLCWIFAGLFFLRKLLSSLFRFAPLSAVLTPFLIFYGTHLFNYTFNYNTHSHAYSFTCVTMFFYFAHRLQNDKSRLMLNALWLVFFLTLNVSIRPLNGLILCCLPAFIDRSFFHSWRPERPRSLHALVLILILCCVVWHWHISYIQTGSIFSYTYTDERFEFANNRFWQSIFSYHIGLLVYVPLFIFAFSGFFFIRRRMALVLTAFFFGVLFLYSSWWYWPITKRAMVDLYAIPALFLCAALSTLERKKIFYPVLSLLVFSVLYYQLKYYQMKESILPEYTAYKEIFWENFFTIRNIQRYPVPPESITGSHTFNEDFETQHPGMVLSGDRAKGGKYSLRLDSRQGVYGMIREGYPSLLKEEGTKKIRLSFDAYFLPDIKEVHVFLLFLDKEDQHLLEIPFYLKEASMRYNEWERIEFGYEFVDFSEEEKVKKIEMRIWNVEGKDAFYIDNAQIESMLTDDAYETIK